MKREVELIIEQEAGNRDPLNVRYWLSGRAISREQAAKVLKEAVTDTHVYGGGHDGVYREYRLIQLP